MWVEMIFDVLDGFEKDVSFGVVIGHGAVKIYFFDSTFVDSVRAVSVTEA